MYACVGMQLWECYALLSFSAPRTALRDLYSDIVTRTHTQVYPLRIVPFASRRTLFLSTRWCTSLLFSPLKKEEEKETRSRLVGRRTSPSLFRFSLRLLFENTAAL